MTEAEDGAGHQDGRADHDPRLQAGLDHLQRAAREMIAASRALLDVAEELVEDPKAASGIIDLLGSVAGRGERRPPHSPADGDDGDDPPVQRIPVS
ncbi:hypothetical protein ACE2AJ_20890 [Aquihabitans daechungensis]|uniref:hypothetical protein n=1 Tax=Aquihabitans daechungensis TaxID=1052257 RepID=UPI003BA242CD